MVTPASLPYMQILKWIFKIHVYVFIWLFISTTRANCRLLQRFTIVWWYIT